jgi:hypothetical protein
MENYKKITWILLLTVLLLGAEKDIWGMKKMLVVVETNTYWATYRNIGQYLSDIASYDNKKAQLIMWDIMAGSNYYQCDTLRKRLVIEYFNAINDGDILEGAVLIGNVPVPQTDPITGYLPLDQVYMDLVNNSTGQPQQYSPNVSPFPASYQAQYYTTAYQHPPGDQIYDIWVSRIDAQYLNGGVRQGPYFYDEYSVYNNYLARLHGRMTAPASVPSRGFAMGPPENFNTLHNDFGQYFLWLNLPWLAEFAGGHNSSYNWMSQLLAGPRGCINFGAFNGTLFPSERNRRYCRYNHLDTVYLPGETSPHVGGVNVSSSDSLGWEWAGVYGHSNPGLTDFYSNPDNGWGDARFNGRFSFGTVGPFWGTNYRIAGGYGGWHYYYQDNSANPNPYNRTLAWKDKKAQWRWKVTATKSYNVYVYYDAPDYPSLNPNNCNYISYYLYQMYLNGASQHVLSHTGATLNLICPDPPNNPCQACGQQTHYSYLPADHKWELIFSNVSLKQDSIAFIVMPADIGYLEYPPPYPSGFPGAITGDRIADAVRFISTDGTVNIIVDDADPTSYTDIDNNPSGIFTTTGFLTDDEVLRAYEDMGDEPGGGGNSKSQFFLTNACGINNFISTHPPSDKDPNFGSAISKNLGNLYGLGHNGLICMGAADDDHPGDNKAPFTTALRDGKDFGEAYIAQQNSHWNYPFYTLLGAGNLRAQPYVQYGTYIEQPRTITGNESTSTYAPVLIQDVNVNWPGNWTVTSTHDASSPFGTHSEIVVRPETHFADSSEVHLRIVN